MKTWARQIGLFCAPGWPGAAGVILAMGALSCGAQQTQDTAKTVERTCPQLTSSVDPLSLPYSTDSNANGKLKSFVSAARGLVDASRKMESMTVEACTNIAKDIGLAASIPANPTAETACAPLVTELEAVKAEGAVLRVVIGAPSCKLDDARRAQCQSTCAADDGLCATGCVTDGEVYAKCTLPTVEVTLSTPSGRGERLATALRSHLPRFAYAEAALGKRLIDQVQSMAKVGAELPPIIDKAGVMGVTCIVASIAAAAEAGSRIQGVLQASALVTRKLVL